MSHQTKTKPIPGWIWHRDRERRRTVVLRKQFELQEPAGDVAFYFACTGSIEIEWNGVPIGSFPESPRMTNTFFRAESFPSRLESGSHTITLRIHCREPMPIQPINIHLHDRSVGCTAFLSGDGLWIPTDNTWDVGDSEAALIGVWGEEPFGELENAPDWFVAGGYGDIEVAPVTDFAVRSAQGLTVKPDRESISIRGTGAGPLSFSEGKARDELYLFYHLLKQGEWKERRDEQRAIDLTSYPQLLIELPQELNVRVRIGNRGSEPVTVWWNGAESMQELEHYEACVTEELRAAAGCVAVSAPQGLKYVKMYIAAEPGAPFDLDIRLEAAGVPLTQVGTFESDSPLMNRIHEVAVHTSRVCHQIGLWDGIKRDRLNWGYDVYMAAKADFTLWNDLEVLRRSIRELGRTPYGYWINALPSYTLWWLCGMWDYYLETGDREFVLEMKEDILKHIAWVKANTDPLTGCFQPEARDEMSFIEWSPMSARESWHSLNAIFYQTKLQIHRLAGYLPELGIRWDTERPALAEDAFTEHSSALLTTLLGIMSGYVSRDKAVHFLASYQPKDPITPLSAYWLAECCSKAGLHDQAWNVVRMVWGSMLEAGATTFWEGVVLAPASDYHHALTTYSAYGSYRMSLCHSWASTPIVWLNKHVLGVQPLEPGYREYVFEPHPVTGVTRCAGVVGTPRGLIAAEWRWEDGRLIAKARTESGRRRGEADDEPRTAGELDLERPAAGNA